MRCAISTSTTTIAARKHGVRPMTTYYVDRAKAYQDAYHIFGEFGSLEEAQQFIDANKDTSLFDNGTIGEIRIIDVNTPTTGRKARNAVSRPPRQYRPPADSIAQNTRPGTITMTINDFTGSHTIDLSRRDKVVYEAGSMMCAVSPWGASDIPLTLNIAITPGGAILHRGWSWDAVGHYLHTKDSPEDVTVTPEMQATIEGLFSGRITVDGVKVGVGRTVQQICPLNLTAEEARTGAKISLA